MTYQDAFFDAPIDRRGTNCEKWDAIAAREGKELLPMWVADMDFRCPTEITDALVKRAAHPVYGYTEQTAEQEEALLSFLSRRHGVVIEAAQQYTLPCVVTGLCAAVNALTEPGDGVIVQPPVYGPFFRTIRESGREILENTLVRGQDGRYTMDFDGLEAFCQKGAKLMLLCSPHNPVGRCWTKEELLRLWAIVNRYGVTLISDEIHWDFVYEEGAFTSMLALPETQASSAALAVLTSASKTFNLAGLLQATLLTRNASLMQALAKELQSTGVTQGNLFSQAATEAAYREGEPWLTGLLAYLHKSRAIVAEELAARLPKAVLSPIEATYLAWVDLRAYGFSCKELERRTHAQGVAFTEGTFFGTEAGEGFLRINFACPHSQLREAFVRLEKAIIAND